jgi:hypothetical protein
MLPSLHLDQLKKGSKWLFFSKATTANEKSQQARNPVHFTAKL